jgi:uncharacterized damage-inducible protein DinB
MSLESVFCTYAADKLTQLCGRVETCVDKLTPEQIWVRHTDNENAVGNLVLHLSGNVRQWILSGVGGERDLRERDTEFDARGGMTPIELKTRLHSTVAAAAALLRSLPPERLDERLSIQKYDVTVLEAILHVVEHFSGHTGQIIFITKFLTGDDLGFYAHLKKTQPHTEKTP